MIFSFLTVFTAAQLSDKPVTVPLSFDHYYSYAQVVEAVKALNKAYPKLTRLDLVGKSDEGREIYSLVVYNPETGEENEKPGVYVDGNIHGNEIQAGEVALYMLNYLLTKYDSNTTVKEIVDRNVFYVTPVLNVDGRYHFFVDANTPNSSRSVRVPFDDDRDGLVDEDYPDDLDGDGSIRQMRKKDPYGDYRLDPEDPRVMVRVNPGKKESGHCSARKALIMTETASLMRIPRDTMMETGTGDMTGCPAMCRAEPVISHSSPLPSGLPVST